MKIISLNIKRQPPFASPFFSVQQLNLFVVSRTTALFRMRSVCARVFACLFLQHSRSCVISSNSDTVHHLYRMYCMLLLSKQRSYSQEKLGHYATWWQWAFFFFLPSIQIVMDLYHTLLLRDVSLHVDYCRNKPQTRASRDGKMNSVLWKYHRFASSHLTSPHGWLFSGNSIVQGVLFLIKNVHGTFNMYLSGIRVCVCTEMCKDQENLLSVQILKSAKKLALTSGNIWDLFFLI